MKKLLWIFLFAAPLAAQISNANPVPWYSATPPTFCPGPLPLYIIANGFSGAGTLYGNTSATTGTSCSALNTPGGGTGTVTSIGTTSPITGGTITTTGTIACPTCVVSTSPGAGVAHFAGSTQAVTSSAVTPSDATGNTTGSGNFVLATSPTLSTPTVTGGTIDNAAIGSTTPSTGSFTNVTDSGLTSGYFPVAGTGGLLGNSILNYGVTQLGVVAIVANNVAFLLYDTGSGYSAVQTSVGNGARYWQAGMRADSNTNCTGATNNVYDFFSGTAGADKAYLCESGLFNAGSLNISGAVTLGGLTNADTGDYVCYNAGVIEYDATACVASLRALKRNISPIHGALAETMKLKPVEYRFRPEAHNSSGDQMHVGLIAEDVAQVDTRLAGYNRKGELETVDYQHLTALLTAAIQEQQREIRALRHEVKRLESVKK